MRPREPRVSITITLTRDGVKYLEALVTKKGVNRSSVVELALRAFAATSRVKIEED